MTEAEQDEVKARFEKLVGDYARKVTQLESDLERKNQAIEGFMAENEALKAELGGKGRKSERGNNASTGRRPLPHPTAHESLEAKIQRWKAR